MPQIFDDNQCRLGEGALWHPLRHSLIWLDIFELQLFERNLTDKQARIINFKEQFSVAGWVSKTEIILASETALWLYHLDNGKLDQICPLEADLTATRSNDGRADPYGGFWIGTMSKTEQPGAGAIYRYYRGELRQLVSKISISNSICFAPDGSYAYFADTPTQQIVKVALDQAGWPCAQPEIHIDLRRQNLFPDGAITDAAGNLWSAQWGAGQVVGYDANGKQIGKFSVLVTYPTCPAIGGDNFDRLFVTSATKAIDNFQPGNNHEGKVSQIKLDTIIGKPENQVVL